MVEFLLSKDFDVKALTMKDIGKRPIDDHVRPEHVLLVSLMLSEDEASWMVLYGNKAYHNFEQMDLTPLTFLNNPIRSAYLVWKDSWASPPPQPKPKYFGWHEFPVAS